MGHLLYLIFRCDFDVMKSLENLEEYGGSEHSPCGEVRETATTRLWVWVYTPESTAGKTRATLWDWC